MEVYLQPVIHLHSELQEQMHIRMHYKQMLLQQESGCFGKDNHISVTSKHAIAVRPWSQLQVASQQLPVPVTKTAGCQLCIMCRGV